MLTVIFVVAVVCVAWKIFVWSLKAAWGIAKILCAVILFPAFLIGLVCVGLLYIAIPILIIGGIVALIGRIAAA